MKYVALLRGINVGTAHRLTMKSLILVFEQLGCTHVSTYINSGNVCFESQETAAEIHRQISEAFAEAFAFPIPLLVKSHEQMRKIAAAVPADWKNDVDQRTDVAYLFADIDQPATVQQLPMKTEYVKIKYVPGALIWNIDRVNYGKSQLNKLIGHPLYQSMTVRNVNTARKLAEW